MISLYYDDNSDSLPIVVETNGEGYFEFELHSSVLATAEQTGYYNAGLLYNLVLLDNSGIHPYDSILYLYHGNPASVRIHYDSTSVHYSGGSLHLQNLTTITTTTDSTFGYPFTADGYGVYLYSLPLIDDVECIIQLFVADFFQTYDTVFISQLPYESFDFYLP